MQSALAVCWGWEIKRKAALFLGLKGGCRLGATARALPSNLIKCAWTEGVWFSGFWVHIMTQDALFEQMLVWSSSRHLHLLTELYNTVTPQDVLTITYTFWFLTNWWICDRKCPDISYGLVSGRQVKRRRCAQHWQQAIRPKHRRLGVHPKQSRIQTARLGH